MAGKSPAVTCPITTTRTPLGLSLTPDDRTQDLACSHLGGFEGARLLAVLLLQPLDEQTVKMRQVAVRPEWQRMGIGTQFIAFAETFAKEHEYSTIVAHARERHWDFTSGWATQLAVMSSWSRLFRIGL